MKLKEKKIYIKEVLPSIKNARMRLDKKVIRERFSFDDKYLHLGDNKKYIVKTYGCQGNLSDSEKISGILEEMGFVKTDNELEANIVLFNTCAIRENAEDRVFGELGRFNKFLKENNNMIIGLCGCMPQEEKTIMKIRKSYPQVDIIFGTHNIHMLPEYIYEIMNKKGKIIDVESNIGNIIEDIPLRRDHLKKAWIPIMYGCDEFCTYCIVPYTRGRERSRKKEDIINEVKDLIQKGYIEVTLLGQNVNAYGKDFEDEVYTFGDLLSDLHQLPIPRIRFTTSHPRDLDDLTIKAFGLGGNIMPHLHLPVQSGNDEVLKRMNRKYTHNDYVDKINKLKQIVPDISITTDIIVAFPGETEEQFQDTLKLVEEVRFEGAYTFIYSAREGTPAANYENLLSEEEKHDRLNRLNEIVNEYSLLGQSRFEGETVEVLVEGYSKNNPEYLTGYTKHNKLVNFEGNDILIGSLVKVKIIKAFSWHLLGELL